MWPLRSCRVGPGLIRACGLPGRSRGTAGAVHVSRFGFRHRGRHHAPLRVVRPSSLSRALREKRAHSKGRPTRKWSRRARRSCAILSPRRAAHLQRYTDSEKHFSLWRSRSKILEVRGIRARPKDRRTGLGLLRAIRFAQHGGVKFGQGCGLEQRRAAGSPRRDIWVWVGAARVIVARIGWLGDDAPLLWVIRGIGGLANGFVPDRLLRRAV